MANFDPRRQVPVAGPLLVMIFLSWTIIAPLVSFYNTGKRIADTQRSAGLQPTCSPGRGRGTIGAWLRQTPVFTLT
ncbi:MAG TPA: hypothetical protein VH089_04570, partial [Streptosporangiaceae bacterium]|nr:hypothetical protein [Streptosporangiaceae bacterium]